MIEINLLPPRERPSWTALIAPLALLLIGLGLAAYLAIGYIDLVDSAEASRRQLAATEQKQNELQSELQSLGKSEGLHGNAADMIEGLRKLRPDLQALLSELELPLRSGSELASVKLNGDGSLLWTGFFPSLIEVGAYSVAIQRESGTGFVFIQSAKAADGGYTGEFQLTPVSGAVKGGDAE
ncbi:hypothetical protein V3851_10970 [Paenibacillus sp. M1]|uniref:Uncharacterized protein n=1 Tax=Paenibacillus haidiansis TaxID=1574488 RepID=A0ABU7VRG0_9BACL